MIKWIIINGIALHAITSALWVQGFAWMMTAFDDCEMVAHGEAAFVAHSFFYFPIVIGEYFGLPLTTEGIMQEETLWETFKGGALGPHPGIASLIWCFALGALIWWGLHRLRGKKKGEVAPQGEA